MPVDNKSKPHTHDGCCGHDEKFPGAAYDSIETFCGDYADMWQSAMQSLDKKQLVAAADMITDAIKQRRMIYSCGNGGSAAIANHLLCDFLKGIQTDTDMLPKVVSLSANQELGSAIANDISYDEVFVYPLRTMADKGDVLLVISSSGNSENVVRALTWAKANGVGTIAFTGFDGGRSSKLADINLHIQAKNYGIVEDCHHALMHMLAQYIRMSHMDAGKVAKVKF